MDGIPMIEDESGLLVPDWDAVLTKNPRIAYCHVESIYRDDDKCAQYGGITGQGY